MINEQQTTRTRRKNPYTPSPQRKSLWLARLATLFIVLTVVGTAAFVLYGRLQATFQSNIPVIGAGDPDLHVVERLYLQTYLVQRVDALQQPASTDEGVVTFTIAPGETADTIAQNLAQAHLIADTELFVNYVRYYGFDAELEAGEFALDKQATIPELAALLTRALAPDITLRFLEGWRLEEMRDYLAVTTPAYIDAHEFLAIAQRESAFDLSRYSFLASLPDHATLEGFLFPDTYSVPLEADAAHLVDIMLQNFGHQVTPAMRQSFGSHNLSLYEAVTLASIVEREAVLAAERPLIANVFYNRLAQEMFLQADPTVQYALGYQASQDNWWKSGLTLVDLQLDSPYNTYTTPGLPPGPIANPGLSALQAVAQPAVTDYLFFVANCVPGTEGQHLFSQTYEEHLINVQQCS